MYLDANGRACFREVVNPSRLEGNAKLIIKKEKHPAPRKRKILWKIDYKHTFRVPLITKFKQKIFTKQLIIYDYVGINDASKHVFYYAKK